MKFFQSPVVRAVMAEISELQEEVYSNVFKFPSMTKEDQLYHVEILTKLIEKQKILYARVSLSDDPEAQKMKDNIIESASMMGIPNSVDMSKVFEQMSTMVQTLKTQIDKNQFSL